MNQLQASPLWRPLCRSLRKAIQPRSVDSYSSSPESRSRLSQASPPGRGRPIYSSPSDHSASRPPRRISSVDSSQPASGAGSPAVGGSSRNCWCSAAGNCSMRLMTWALASICAAWLSVMPVTANSSMPARQSAELIQCH
ncbi:hypothetical protein D3C77_524870 [compost metagenome]